MANTSGCWQCEFVYLLFLQSHRESDLFLGVSGVQLVQTNFHFHHVTFSSQLKSRWSTKATINAQHVPLSDFFIFSFFLPPIWGPLSFAREGRREGREGRGDIQKGIGTAEVSGGVQVAGDVIPPHFAASPYRLQLSSYFGSSREPNMFVETYCSSPIWISR